MCSIYLINITECFHFITTDNVPTLCIPDNYDDIVPLVLSCSKKNTDHPDVGTLMAIRSYFIFHSDRLLLPFWEKATAESYNKKLLMWEGELPLINTKQSLYVIVQQAKKSNFLVLDTSKERVFLPDGRILPENKAQEWHEQIQEMMVFGQQQMDLGFPQSNSLMRKYFAEQLTQQIIDLGFILESLKNVHHK